MTIDIESLTLKEIREITALAGCSNGPKRRMGEKFNTSEAVIVRAYSGVFFGYLARKQGNCVVLHDARQIYTWGSAGMSQKVNTCPDIAARGLGTDSKVSEPAPRALVEQVGAIFFATPEAVKIINAQKWGTR